MWWRKRLVYPFNLLIKLCCAPEERILGALSSRTRKVSCAPKDVDSTKSPFEDHPLYKAVTFLSRARQDKILYLVAANNKPISNLLVNR